MNEGHVESDILIAMPQSDDREKRRPALVLRRMPGFQDVLVCGISSRISRAVPDFDLVLSSGSDDYVRSGLVTDSVIRLGYLTVIPASKVSGANCGFARFDGGVEQDSRAAPKTPRRVKVPIRKNPLRVSVSLW